APMPELTADAERSAMSWAALTTPLFMLLALLTALDCIDSMLAAIPTFMPRTWAELVELMVEIELPTELPMLLTVDIADPRIPDRPDVTEAAMVATRLAPLPAIAPRFAVELAFIWLVLAATDALAAPNCVV